MPVIAVFTKHDQFLRNVKIDLEDYGNPGDNVTDAAKRLFKEHYLRHIGAGARFVRLESAFGVKCQMLCANPLVKGMHKVETRCDSLLKETAEALNEDVLDLMLVAVQKSDLAVSVRIAAKRCVFHVKDRERMQSHQT